MGTTLAVRAFSFASTLSPKDLVPLLEKAGGAVRSTKTQVVSECTNPEGWVTAYDFGAIAFIGIDDERRETVMKAVLARIGPEPHPPMEEQILIERSDTEKPGVAFDRVLAPKID